MRFRPHFPHIRTPRTEFEDLAQMIEALPGRFRTQIVTAALRLAPSADIDSSRFVGMYRTRLYDCVAHRHGCVSVASWRAAVAQAEPQLRPIVVLFAEAPDLSSVRSVLADLLQVIADALNETQL